MVNTVCKCFLIEHVKFLSIALKSKITVFKLNSKSSNFLKKVSCFNILTLNIPYDVRSSRLETRYGETRT